MKKILYFDCETTGLDAVHNGIVQLSGLIDVGGEVKEGFDIKMKTFPGDDISDESLKVHGMSIEEIETFQTPQKAFNYFTTILGKYCNKYDKSDKFYPAGYNVTFDLNFIQEWFKKNGNKFGFGVWQNWKAIDPLPYIRMLDYKGIINIPSLKLETVCDYYGIEIKAHDAMSDIVATREIVNRVLLNISQIHENVKKYN